WTNIDPTKKALTLLDEFKTFAFKGNVIDLAVGVIIGAAFGKIVESLVKNIIMPSIALLTPGEKSYVQWKLVVGETEVAYRLFLGEFVNFMIVAVVLFFFIVKFLGWVLRTKLAQKAPPLSKDQQLLTEIRDLLKQQAAQKPL